MKAPTASISAYRRTCVHAAPQHGIALISSLLILVIIMLLGLSMMRSFGLQEKVAGNIREKQRSLQAAESALQYAEWSLDQGSGNNTGIDCLNQYNSDVVSQIQTCANPLLEPTNLPWKAYGNYLAPSSPTTYFLNPAIYINYLGLNPTGKSLLYQVTAAGYGGTANGASVVQSVYAIPAKSTALDQP